MKKRLSFLAATLVLAALVAGVGFASVSAVAAEEPTEGSEAIEGAGTLYARGSGIAALHGGGTVHIWGHGEGAIAIKGAEHIEVEGHGERTVRDDGVVIFHNWQGQIEVAGHDVQVRMRSPQIEFLAQGHGRVHLDGEGIVCINGHDNCHHWPDDGATLHYGP